MENVSLPIYKVMDAQDWSGWWASEKYDGVLIYWCPERDALLGGKVGGAYVSPQWFRDALPRVPLQAELWGGRGSFEWVCGLARTQCFTDREDELWQQVKLMCFELPGHPGKWEERMACGGDLLHGNPVAEWAPQHLIPSQAWLKAYFDEIVADGGEGVVLHRPGALFEPGYSNHLVKLVPEPTMEVVVLAHLPGGGRHTGRMGALRVMSCKDPEMPIFRVGTGFSDAERDNPPALGSRITIKYRMLTAGGVPRFPSYVRPRPEGV